MRTGRRLGVDVGDVRIGVAACDRDAIMASPVETIGAGPQAIARLLELIEEYEPIEIVVGLPIGLSGREGPAAAKIRTFVAELDEALDSAARARHDGARFDVGIRLIDERMSTMTAQARLRSSGRSTKNSRSVVDQVAAIVILESALEAERLRDEPPGEVVRNPTKGTT